MRSKGAAAKQRPSFTSDQGPTWAVRPDGSALDVICDCTGGPLSYGRWTITRDGSNNITAVTAPASLTTLATASVDWPSLVIDRNGFPVLAWVEFFTRQVRFLRATGDPSVAGNWKNSQGTSTTPDSLGTASTAGAPSLARMPAAAPPGANDDALYVFFFGSNGQARWTRARVSGADYTAWSAPVDIAAALDSNHSVPAVADSQNRGIVYAYHVNDTNKYRMFRKQSADDSNANDVTLLGTTPAIGGRMSLTVDRGDIYAFYETSSGQLAYRKHFPESGLDATETIIGTSPSTFPTARQNLGDGSIDVAWSSGTQTLHHRFAGRAASRLLTLDYQYDRLYRLTSATFPTGGTTTYTYDPVGNRSSMVRGGTTTSYSYDRSDRITAAGATSYTVNANGNTTGRGTDTFAYDQANRLRTASIGGATSTYTYDGDGKRATRTPAGGVAINYVYDVNRSLPVVLDDGARKYVWGLGLAYSVDISGGAIGVYHTDGLGSVRAVSDSTASVVQTYQTDEFGVATLTQGTSAQPFQYTGEQRDSESGFIYLRARMYEPGIGRFLQRDPVVSFPDSTTNGYAYVSNCPITLADPSGLVIVALCYFPVREAGPGQSSIAHTAVTLLDDDNIRLQIFHAGPVWEDSTLYLRGIAPESPGWPIPGSWGCEALLNLPGQPIERKSQILSQFRAEFNAQNIEYRFWPGPNSNTYARLALERLGLTGIVPRRPAPGWSYPLELPVSV